MMYARRKRGEVYYYNNEDLRMREWSRDFFIKGWCCYNSHQPRGLFILQALPPWSIDISTHGMLEILTHFMLDLLTHDMPFYNKDIFVYWPQRTSINTRTLVPLICRSIIKFVMHVYQNILSPSFQLIIKF